MGRIAEILALAKLCSKSASSGGNVPTKLSDLENDLFYIKREPFLKANASDFVLVEEMNNTMLFDSGIPIVDWLVDVDDICFLVNTLSMGTFTEKDMLCERAEPGVFVVDMMVVINNAEFSPNLCVIMQPDVISMIDSVELFKRNIKKIPLDFLDIDLTDIEGAVEVAQSTADSAQTTANAAKTTADSAQTTANAAKTTADSAQTTANAAKTTADSASHVHVTSNSYSLNLVNESCDIGETVEISGDYISTFNIKPGDLLLVNFLATYPGEGTSANSANMGSLLVFNSTYTGSGVVQFYNRYTEQVCMFAVDFANYVSGAKFTLTRIS